MPETRFCGRHSAKIRSDLIKADVTVDPNQPMSAESRQRLIVVFEESARISNRILENQAPFRQLATVLELRDVLAFVRVLDFTALLRFDVSTLFVDLLRKEHDHSAHVYARFLILVIYEGTKTYRRSLGKELQKELSGSPRFKDLLSRVREAHQGLSRVFKRVDREFGDIRNGIAAHRDAEAMNQLDDLRSIGGEDIASLVEEFLLATGPLESALLDFTSHIRNALSGHAQTVFLPIGSRAEITPTPMAHGEEVELDTHGSQENWDWTSSDENVASVNAAGVVEAIAKGYAQVNVRLKTHPLSEEVSVLVLVVEEHELPQLSEAWAALFQ